MSFENKNILVVGASGVLGREISNLLASQGARVLGTATSSESAVRIPDSVSMKLLLDLTSDQSIDALSKYLVASEKLDGIVMAAGRVGFGKLNQTSDSDLEKLMKINFSGFAKLVTDSAPALQPDSFICAITGVVAEKAFPGMAAYSASKAALSAWLGVAGLELRREGVKVFEVRPGHTETGLATRPLFGEAPQMPQGMSPSHVAAKTVEAINNRATYSSGDF